MKKKLLSLAAAAALLISCLSGCNDAGVRSYSGTTDSSVTSAVTSDSETSSSATTSGDASVSETPTLDYDAAYAKYNPDDVVMTINGEDVKWSEFFYWLYSNVSSSESELGTIDWSAENSSVSGMTNQEYFIANSEFLAKQYRAIEVNAAKLGVELTDEDEEYLEQMWQDEVDTYGDGDEEYFIEYLESLYLSKDMDDYFNRVSLMYSKAFEAIYGENGSGLSDEDTISYAEDAGYMHIKHILIKTVDDDGESISDEEKAEKKTIAEGLLTQLQAVADDHDALVELFDQLCTENTEDEGISYYPDGYVFTEGQMVEEFEEASESLEEYQLSDLVETQYGYHILIKLPLSPDDIVEYYSDGQAYDLRYLAAWNMYTATVESWFDEAEIVYSDEFKDLDLSQVFDTYVTTAE